MRKIVCLFLVVSFLVVLTGCETKEEKAARLAREEAEMLNKQYYETLNEYNDLKNDINNYYYNQNRLGN